MRRIPSYLRLWIGLLVLLALGAGGYALTMLPQFSDSSAATTRGVITVHGHIVTRTRSVTLPARTVTRQGKRVVIPSKVITHVSKQFLPGTTVGVPVLRTVTGQGGTVTVDKTITQPVTVSGPTQTTTVVRSVTGTTTVLQTVTIPVTQTETVVQTQTVPVVSTTTETVTVTVAPPPTT